MKNGLCFFSLSLALWLFVVDIYIFFCARLTNQSGLRCWSHTWLHGKHVIVASKRFFKRDRHVRLCNLSLFDCAIDNVVSLSLLLLLLLRLSFAQNRPQMIIIYYCLPYLWLSHVLHWINFYHKNRLRMARIASSDQNTLIVWPMRNIKILHAKRWRLFFLVLLNNSNRVSLTLFELCRCLLFGGFFFKCL